MANRAKHVFGSLENIDAVLQNGTIDQYDTLFLKDKNGNPYIGWIDEDRNKVIVENSAMSHVPQADWNQNDETAKDYIKNKPFGETTVMGDTLTWDGNTEGLTIVNDNMPIMGYLVSNVAPTFEQLKNGVTIVKKNFNGDEIERLEFSYEEIMEEYAPESDQIILGQVFIQMNDLYYTASDLVDGEWVPSEKVSPKGMWLHVDCEFENYIAEVQIHGAKLFETTEIKKIPTEYLPDGVGYDTREVKVYKYEWDRILDGKETVEIYGSVYVKVSDEPIPALLDTENPIFYDQTRYKHLHAVLNVPNSNELFEEIFKDSTDAIPAWCVSGERGKVGYFEAAETTMALNVTENDVFEDVPLTRGMYFCSNKWDMAYLDKLEVAVEVGELHKIPEKYLPSGGVTCIDDEEYEIEWFNTDANVVNEDLYNLVDLQIGKTVFVFTCTTDVKSYYTASIVRKSKYVDMYELETYEGGVDFIKVRIFKNEESKNEYYS